MPIDAFEGLTIIISRLCRGIKLHQYDLFPLREVKIPLPTGFLIESRPQAGITETGSGRDVICLKAFYYNGFAIDQCNDERSYG
jgi:hypothetical protein